jgi:hypothetical protein
VLYYEWLAAQADSLTKPSQHEDERWLPKPLMGINKNVTDNKRRLTNQS